MMRDFWNRGLCAGALMVCIFSAHASSVATGKDAPGPDPQFVVVSQALESKAATFSNGGRRIAPCPGSKNVYSFECEVVREKPAAPVRR